MKRFAIRTLGCKVNQYESEAMEKLFIDRGYQHVSDHEISDVYIINTCTVTALSDAKCRQQIHRLKRLNPKAIICVVGCYSQVSSEEIEKIEGVDIILGTKGRRSIVDLVENYEPCDVPLNVVSDLETIREFDELSAPLEQSMTRAYLKIQEGCDMFCSYCIIPYARGHIASRKLENIQEEAEKLAEAGFRELVLTGIHVASYGKELKNGTDLIDAIEAVAEIPQIERIRLSSIEPRWVNTQVLTRMKNTGKCCDHFHLSLQSGSDAILKRMNRKYDTALYREKIKLIRQFFPDAGITTDVIVGFPGEGEREFQETLQFCEEIRFSKIHIFPYSPRKGTPAAAMKEHLTNKEKKSRAKELSKIEEKLRYEFLDSYLNRTVSVLFEEFSGDGEIMYGYTDNYMRVSCPRNFEAINQVSNVRILRRNGDVLIGQIIAKRG